MLSLVFANDDAPTNLPERENNAWRDSDGNVVAFTFSRDERRWIEWPGLGVFGFSTASKEVTVWPEPGTCRQMLTDAFSRILQPFVLQTMGWQALHAAAVMDSRGVLAFCGKSGSGKSTIAFALQQLGWQQFADDALVFRCNEGQILSHQMPFAPRLRSASRDYFGVRDIGCASSTPRDLGANASLAAVFLLEQDHALTNPSIAVIPPARAFSELLAHAVCFNDLKETRRLAEDYLALAQRVPAFRLVYPPRLKILPLVMSAVTTAVASVTADVAGFSSRQPASLST